MVARNTTTADDLHYCGGQTYDVMYYFLNATNMIIIIFFYIKLKMDIKYEKLQSIILKFLNIIK